jgi:hypothetical protein
MQTFVRGRRAAGTDAQILAGPDAPCAAFWPAQFAAVVPDLSIMEIDIVRRVVHRHGG